MSDRRRRKKRRKLTGKNGCLRGIIIFLIFICTAAFGGPWAVSKLQDSMELLTGEVREAASVLIPAQQPETVEADVPEAEVENGFYYSQLGEEERLIYRELLQGVRNMEPSIYLHAGKDSSSGKVYEYLLYDRPELFWCSGSSKMTVYEEHTEFCPQYTCTSEVMEARRQETEQAADECIGKTDENSSDYDKIRMVYEYLINTVDYDENAADNQNIYSALVGKRSVCAGYSRAAQYLLEKLGVECIYVTGEVAGQGAHAWNIVSCNGRYYQMDVTFGDPVYLEEESGEKIPKNMINYDYLCCTDSEMAADHIQNTEVDYPDCISDDLNYYKMNGMYYETFDPELLLEKMKESIRSGEEMFICRFSDSEVYFLARDQVTDVLFMEAAGYLSEIYGTGNVKYTYMEDEIHNKITVFWNYQ